MMYILTEQEYNDLKKTKDLKITKQTKDLQELCTKIAETMPVDWGWGDRTPKPWGCILSQKDEWYCDSCPVTSICPNPYKSWSK